MSLVALACSLSRSGQSVGNNRLTARALTRTTASRSSVAWKRFRWLPFPRHRTSSFFGCRNLDAECLCGTRPRNHRRVVLPQLEGMPCGLEILFSPRGLLLFFSARVGVVHSDEVSLRGKTFLNMWNLSAQTRDGVPIEALFSVKSTVDQSVPPHKATTASGAKSHLEKKFSFFFRANAIMVTLVKPASQPGARWITTSRAFSRQHSTSACTGRPTSSAHGLALQTRTHNVRSARVA